MSREELSISKSGSLRSSDRQIPVPGPENTAQKVEFFLNLDTNNLSSNTYTPEQLLGIKKVYEKLVQEHSAGFAHRFSELHGTEETKESFTKDVPNIYEIPKDLDKDIVNSHIEMQRQTQKDLQLTAERLYRFEQAGSYDSLTGLLQRDAFSSRYEEAKENLVLSQNKEEKSAVVFIDLDHFKTLNDTYGHPAVDQALALVGSEINRTLRSHDAAGRRGGDELTVMLNRLPNQEAVDKAVERLFNTIGSIALVREIDKITNEVNTYVATKGTLLEAGENISREIRYISASLGVKTLSAETITEQGKLMEDFLAEADSAVYAVKEKPKNGGEGRNGIAFIDSIVGDKPVGRIFHKKNPNGDLNISEMAVETKELKTEPEYSKESVTNDIMEKLTRTLICVRKNQAEQKKPEDLPTSVDLAIKGLAAAIYHECSN